MMFPVIHGILTKGSAPQEYHPLIQSYSPTVFFDFPGNYGIFDQGSVGVNISSLDESNIQNVGDGFPVMAAPSITGNVTGGLITPGPQSTYIVAFRSTDPMKSFASLFCHADNNSFMSFRFALNTNNASFAIKVDSTLAFTEDTIVNVIDNNWHVLVASRDDDSFNFYVDGSLSSTLGCESGIPNSNALELGIMRDSDGSASSSVPRVALSSIVPTALNSDQVSEVTESILYWLNQ